MELMKDFNEIIKTEKPLGFIFKLLKAYPRAEVFLVGGMVRDLILGRPSIDYDFVVRNLELKKLEDFLKKAGRVNLVGKNFGVLKFRPKGSRLEAIDLALPRTEFALGTGGYHDFKVQSDHKLPIQEDLSRRDFTINAMAWDLKKRKLIDPFGGQGDLKRGLIKAVGLPEERFKEDYSRILRALRLMVQLDFKIEIKTWGAVKKLIGCLNDKVVPRETIAKEFLKSLEESPLKTFDFYEQSGAFKVLMPEILAMKKVVQPEEFHTEGDVFIHTKMALATLDSKWFKQFFPTKNSLEAVLAILFHDIGKPGTFTAPASPKEGRVRFNNHNVVGAEIARDICDRLKLSSYEGRVNTERVFWLVKNHLILMAGKIVEMRATTIEKYFFNDKFSGEDLLRLSLADVLATIPPSGQPNLTNFNLILARIKELTKVGPKKKELAKPLLNGHEIMKKFKLKSGPKIGELTKALREEQLSGRLKDKQGAFKFLKKHLKK